MRIIGLDIHRAFAEAVAWQEGKLKRIGRIGMRRDQLTAFAASLLNTDVVAVKATGNAAAVAAVISPHVKRVVIAKPMQVRVIAHAKIKTDKIDATALAKLRAICPSVDAGRGNREAAAAGVSAHPGCAADDPGEEPDPQHPACQPDPTLPQPVVRRRAPGLIGAYPLAPDEKLAIQRCLTELDQRAKETAVLV